MKDFGTRSHLVVLLLSLSTMLGCSALNASQPAAQPATGLVTTSTALDFGTVPVGTTATRTNTIVNNTASPITLTRAQISQTDFTISGQKLPLHLAPGQSTVVQVVYSPRNGGTSQGKVVFASNVIRSSATFTLRGTAIASGKLAVNPASITFGSVNVGKTQTQSATITNAGLSDVTISHATISGNEFALTGLNLPLQLKAKQSATVQVSFTPAAGGADRATISLIGTTTIRFTRRSNTVLQDAPTDVAVTTTTTALNVPVSGVGMMSGELTASPAAVALGKVKIGASQTQSVALVNSGDSTVTVKQATVSGRGFRMSGLSFPLTLSPGQKKSFAVTFTPQLAGTSTGTVAVTSDAPNSVVSVPVSATAVGSSALVSNPSSLTFANVQAGHSQTLSATVTNSGETSVTISQASATGAGFVAGSLSLPLTLAPGQSIAIGVTFTAQSSSPVSGTLSLVSDAGNGALAIPLSATTGTAGALSTSDSTLDFPSVQIGGTTSLPETLTNTGGSTVTVTQASVSGTAFKVTGLSLPLTLNPGQSFTFGTAFSPTSGGDSTGSISVTSDASNPKLTISMAGTASVSGQLAVSPATLSFGNVVVGQSKSLSASLTATGSSITVTGASMSTSEFTVSGLSLPVTIAAGKSVSFTVNFAPQSSGVAAAGASFASNASNASPAQSLTGTGTPAPQHSVALSWSPSSSSSVVGYNIYRGVTSGGPYSKIDSGNADTTYTDSSVQAGQTYFYVTTAVDSSGKESTNSNQTQAVIPTP